MLQRMQRAHGREGRRLNEEVLLNGLFSSGDATITFKIQQANKPTQSSMLTC